MGNVVGGITNALFGKGGAGIAGDAVARGRELGEQAYFRPYTVTTGTGTSQYQDGELQARLSAPYAGLQQAAVTGAGGILPQLTGAVTAAPAQFSGYGAGLLGEAATRAMAQPAQFGYTPDLAGRTQEIFGQQAELLQPEFQRQATELQGRLFGSGRLGLRLAGESQGLGADSGMVSPDALGLGRAQQQTLANLATTARQQALGEEAQRYQQELGTFGTNVAQQQQALQNLLGVQGQGFGQAAQGFGLNEQARQAQISNLMGLQQGLFGQAIGTAGLEDALIRQGLDAETARAAAAYGSGQMQLAPYQTQAQIAQQQRGQNAGFFGSLLGGALSGGLFSGAGAATTTPFQNSLMTANYAPTGTAGFNPFVYAP